MQKFLNTYQNIQIYLQLKCAAMNIACCNLVDLVNIKTTHEPALHKILNIWHLLA